jgi:hypothetical protein
VSNGVEVDEGQSGWIDDPRRDADGQAAVRLELVYARDFRVRRVLLSTPRGGESVRRPRPVASASRSIYLGETRLFGPCTNTKPGVVPMTTNSSPLGATNKPKDSTGTTEGTV